MSILIILLIINLPLPNIEIAVPATEIYFPKRPATGSQGYYFHEALITGELGIKNHCIGLKHSENSFTTLLYWPDYYTLVKLEREIHLVRRGKSIAKTGDYIRMGGAETGHKIINVVRTLPLKEHIALYAPKGLYCQPPYWQVGSTRKTPLQDLIRHKLRWGWTR